MRLVPRPHLQSSSLSPMCVSSIKTGTKYGLISAFFSLGFESFIICSPPPLPLPSMLLQFFSSMQKHGKNFRLKPQVFTTQISWLPHCFVCFITIRTPVHQLIPFSIHLVFLDAEQSNSQVHDGMTISYPLTLSLFPSNSGLFFFLNWFLTLYKVTLTDHPACPILDIFYPLTIMNSVYLSTLH